MMEKLYRVILTVSVTSYAATNITWRHGMGSPTGKVIEV